MGDEHRRHTQAEISPNLPNSEVLQFQNVPAIQKIEKKRKILVAAMEKLLQINEEHVDFHIYQSLRDTLQMVGIEWNGEMLPQRTELIRQLQEQLLITVNEQQLIKKDLQFFEKKGIKDPTERSVIKEISEKMKPAGSYEKIFNELVKETSLSPKLRAFVQEIQTLITLVNNENTSNARDIATVARHCSLTFHTTSITLSHIIGAQQHFATFEAIRSARTMAELHSAKNSLREVLLSGRTMAALFFLHTNTEEFQRQPGVLFKEFTQFLENGFFEHVDAMQHIVSVTRMLNEKFDTQKNHTKSLAAFATFLEQQVSNGQINSTMARELYIDFQHNSIDQLFQNYWLSFLELLQSDAVGEVAKPTLENKSIRLRWVLTILVLIATLSVADTGSRTDLQRVFQNIAAATARLPGSISKMLESKFGWTALAPLNQASTAAKETPTPAPIVGDTLSQVLEGNAQRAVDLNARPLTATEMTHPAIDGMSGEFRPSSVSLEGYRAVAASAIWELKNWTGATPADVRPNFLSATTFDKIDPATADYTRWEPDPAQVGVSVSGAAYQADIQTPRLVLGQRDDISNNWFEIGHPEQMKVSAGSVWVFIDGQYTSSYPLNWLQSPESDDQFARVQIEQKDISWMNDRRNEKKKLSFEIVLQFAPFTAENARPFVETQFPQKLLPFADLPADLQSTVQKINQDQQLSDDQKLDQLAQWYSHFGIYSFNPVDDQWQYVNQAVKAGRIPVDQEGAAFYHAFYLGAKYAPLGLANSDFPRAGAGECNRRNTAAVPVFNLLKLNKKWKFSLEAGSVVGGSDQIMGSSAHMRMKAEADDGTVKFIDVTGAAGTDTATQKMLSAVGQPVDVSSSVAAGTENGSENGNQQVVQLEPVVLPNPHNYPTVLPQISLDPNRFEARLFSFQDSKNGDQAGLDPYGWTINLPHNELPWEFSKIHFQTKFYNPHFPTYVYGPVLRFGAQGKIEMNAELLSDSSVKESFINTPTEVKYRDMQTYTVTLHGTNTVPILSYFTGTVGQIDVNSIRISADSLPLPFRIEKTNELGVEPYFVIDLPMNTLDGREITVTFQRFEDVKDADYIITDLPQPTDNLRPITEVMDTLKAEGFSQKEIYRLYIEHMLYGSSFDYTNIHRIHQFLPQLQKDTAAQKELNPEIIIALQDLLLVERAQDTTAYNQLLTEIDKQFPNFLTQWLTITPGHQLPYPIASNDGVIENLHKLFPTIDPGFISNFGEDGQIWAALQLGKQVSLKDILVLSDSTSSRISIENNAMAGALYGYITQYLLPTQLPYERLAFFEDDSKFTPDLSLFTACQQNASTNTEFVQCLLNAPLWNSLSLAYINAEIYKHISDQQIHSLDLDFLLTQNEGSLQTQLDVAGLAGIYSFSKPRRSPQNELISGEADRRDSIYDSDMPKSPSQIDKNAERTKAFAQQIDTLNQWYPQEVLRELGAGYEKTWEEFLVLFGPLAVAAYGGLWTVANRRRWAGIQTSSDLLRRRPEWQVISEQLATELHIPLPAVTNSQLDRVWGSQPLGSDKVDLFYRRLVTQTGRRGSARAPFNILGQHPQKPENPWKSRDVPPTYELYKNMALINVSALAESLTSTTSSSARVQNVQQIVTQLIEHGIAGNGKELTAFRSNRVILDNEELWRNTCRTQLKQRLMKLGIVVEEEAVTSVVEQILQPWKLIMNDWKTMNVK